VDLTSSGSLQMVGFGISGVKPRAVLANVLINQ
jgi:hypothetical protein